MYKIEKMDIKDYEEIIDLWENTDYPNNSCAFFTRLPTSSPKRSTR